MAQLRSGSGGGGGLSAVQLNIQAILSPLGNSASDTTQIKNAIDAAKLAGGGIVLLRPGTYSIQSDIVPSTNDYMCGVILMGSGEETELSLDSGITTAGLRLAGTSVAATRSVNNLNAGQSTITMPVANDAALFTAGDIIAIKGTDTESNVDVESRHEVTATNSISGVVTLREPIFKTLSSVTIADGWGSDDNTYSTMRNGVQNLVVKLNYSPGAAISGILVTAHKDFTIKDVIFRGWANNFATNDNCPLVIQQALHARIENVLVEGSKNQGIILGRSYLSTIVDCTVDTCMTSTSSAPAIDLNGSYDCLIKNSLVNRGLGTGGGIGFSGSNPARRNEIRGCRVYKTVSYGVNLTNTKNTIVSGCYFEATADAGVYMAGQRNIVRGNSFFNCYLAGQFVGSNGSYCIFTGNTIAGTTSYGVFGSSGCLGGVVTNNTFNTGGGNDPCISTITSTGFNISGNTIYTWTGKGIYLQTSCVDNLINGNMIFGATGTAIQLDNGCTNNLISLNHLRGLTLTTGSGAGNDFISNKV